MKFLDKILPHIALALALGVMVLTVLDSFNPLMAFLTSTPSKVFLLAASLSAAVLCVREISR